MLTAIGGLAIRSTQQVITPDTKICALVYAPPKFGKTTLGASLDKMTRQYFGKPTLFIACEAGEGGGTMSIQDYDIPFVAPQSLDELDRVLSALTTDTTFGGVVLDSSTEIVNRFVKPYALKFPSREHTPTRTAGVPEQSDYQTMGEKMREILNKMVNLTALVDPKLRKHVMVTATEKEKTERATGKLVAIQPELPGAMAQSATAIFQTVASIGIRTVLIDNPAKAGQKIRSTSHLLITQADGVRIVGDRTKAFPAEGPLDFVEIWEKHWLPRLAAIQEKAAA